MIVVITGSAGNLGTKLRHHFDALGWKLRLLDAKQGSDKRARVADLATWNEDWINAFQDADAVVHLAGDPSPQASWASAQRLNIDLTMNVFEAAARHGVPRVIFASSNWVVAGHRFGDLRLTPDIEAAPVNPYGVSKLVGERLGRSYSERWGLSAICFRIGYCQTGDNQPGPHMGWGLWGQRMWLSNRDLCQGFEKAVLAPADLKFAVLNLMSRNDNMRWELDTTRMAIGYEPADHFSPQESEELTMQATAARDGRHLVEATERFMQDRQW